jgi:hypothetical protein
LTNQIFAGTQKGSNLDRDFPISLSVAGWEANIRVFLSFYASTCNFYSFTIARRKLKERHRVLPETLWDDFEEEKKKK